MSGTGSAREKKMKNQLEPKNRMMKKKKKRYIYDAHTIKTIDASIDKQDDNLKRKPSILTKKKLFFCAAQPGAFQAAPYAGQLSYVILKVYCVR